MTDTHLFYADINHPHHWFIDGTTALPELAIVRSAQAAFDRHHIPQTVHRHAPLLPCEHCFVVRERT
jgi:hypothetical protein